MTDKLLPCPFCGEDMADLQELLPSPWDGKIYWRVICMNCCCEIADDSHLKAVRAWNKRVPLQAKPERDLVYLASPYGGKHENYTRAQRDMMILTETYRQYDFISPIVSYGFCYDNYSYDDGIAQCLGLLSHCDQLWVLHDDGESRGVKLEREYAKRHNIPIKEMSENV